MVEEEKQKPAATLDDVVKAIDKLREEQSLNSRSLEKLLREQEESQRFIAIVVAFVAILSADIALAQLGVQTNNPSLFINATYGMLVLIVAYFVVIAATIFSMRSSKKRGRG